MTHLTRPTLTGAFAHNRKQQGVPLMPVPTSGMTGQPQGPQWSIADAIMASHVEPDVDDRVGEVGDVADWDEWNTPRYDVERFYVADCRRRDLAGRSQYLHEVQDGHLQLREYIKMCIREFNVVGGGVVRGVITPVGQVDHDAQNVRKRRRRKKRS